MIPVGHRTSPRRLWLLRPRTILLAIGLAILAAFAADRTWTRGNGLVAGELTAVAPIVQSRLKQLFVRCLDHVARGQRLAEFENEATVEAAAQQLQQLQLQLTESRAEIDIAQGQAEAARKLIDAQSSLRDQLAVVLKAMDQLMKSGFVAILQREQVKANLAQAEAETSAAEFVYQTKKSDQKKAELMVSALEDRILSYKNSPELNGHFYMTAPKDGVITECTAHPGEVIAARSPIFQLFNPDDVYAVVFFNAEEAPRLAMGQSFSINIGGVAGTLTGRITGFYPELSALPASLTRFFWQQETWSQYAPARLDFDEMSATQKSKLVAWAQLSASRTQDGLPALAAELWHSAPSRWVRQLVASARRNILSMSAATEVRN
jgi:multidrug resistance efflux pump